MADREHSPAYLALKPNGKRILHLIEEERPKFPDRKIEPLHIRKERQALESEQAMKDYKHTQEAARERMAALRAERQAREGQQAKEHRCSFSFQTASASSARSWCPSSLRSCC